MRRGVLDKLEEAEEDRCIEEGRCSEVVIGDAELSASDGTRLVEDDDIDGVGVLEGLPCDAEACQ